MDMHVRIKTNLEPQGRKGLQLISCRRLFPREFGVFRYVNNLHSRKVPGRESGVSRKCSRKGKGRIPRRETRRIPITRLPGRNPEGKSEKVGLGSQMDRNEHRLGGVGIFS